MFPGNLIRFWLSCLGPLAYMLTKTSNLLTMSVPVEKIKLFQKRGYYDPE